jgi:uncharacterized protein YdhG (YjbR/CyaY superfamily)
MNNVNDYIDGFEGKTKDQLVALLNYLSCLLPEAEAYISYKMPCFKKGKNIVYFAGYKNHIGFYPTAKPIEKFKA